MIKIRPIRDKEELQKLLDNAADDDHTVIGATHLLIKGDEIVGYASISGIPMVHTWCSSKRMTASDSLIAISQLEAILANNEVPRYIMACSDDSPFKDKMDKLGFSPVFTTNLFVKEI